MMIKIACTEEEASCLIPNIIAETKTPCPCKEKHGLAIEGYTYDGREVKIQIQSGTLLRKAPRIPRTDAQQKDPHLPASQRSRLPRLPHIHHRQWKGYPKGSPHQPGTHEEETAEVQGHVRQWSHDEARDRGKLPKLEVTRRPRRLPCPHSEVRPDVPIHI